MLELERLSRVAIASSSARSSSDKRIGIGFFAAIPRGKRERGSWSSCFIVLYCDPLVIYETHYLQKTANSQYGIAEKCKQVTVYA